MLVLLVPLVLPWEQAQVCLLEDKTHGAVASVKSHQPPTDVQKWSHPAARQLATDA